MKYISTRGGIAPIPFKETVMMGLATDGGLILPDHFPAAGKQDLEKWQDLTYPELALEVISLFVDDIPREELKGLIDRAYETFDHKEITPLVHTGRYYILELFHGPTLAFKDIALQFLGNLFSYLLRQKGTTMNVLGATSGDTGSAAIYGVKGKDNINIFILHPRNRVSPVQELQMTTVPDANVFNIAIEGTFDDCQAIVKTIFNDLDFKSKYRLGSVNSINWARVLAQVVYYIYAALKLATRKGSKMVHFSVPTGNFGDIFAGYVAKRVIGGQIGRLIIATNENNILSRFILEGKYSKGNVVPTISPSMDIQIASNFERYLYYLFGEDPGKVKEAMEQFNKKGEIVVSQEQLAQARKDFATASIDQQTTIETIKEIYKQTDYIVDPHTAVGCAAAERLSANLKNGDIVCLATAHPAKFPDAVKKAIGRLPERPERLKGLEKRPSRCKVLPADVEIVKEYVAEHALI